MQQKGRTEQILDRLQDMIVNGQASLAPGKVTVPKDDMLRIVQELSDTMKIELRQYRDITDKRAKILREAQKEADDIIYEAEQTASRIRVSGRKTKVAPVRMLDLTETERRSLDNANEIYAASLIYTDEMMAEMEQVVHTAYERIHASYVYALQDLKVKSEMIAANRRELMEDLRSLEKEDRYQQILEIGQLLSQELYHARKREMEEANNQNMQLELDFGNQNEVQQETEAVEVTQSETTDEKLESGQSADEVVKADEDQLANVVVKTDEEQLEQVAVKTEEEQLEQVAVKTDEDQLANVVVKTDEEQFTNVAVKADEDQLEQVTVKTEEDRLEEMVKESQTQSVIEESLSEQQPEAMNEQEMRHRQFVEAHEEIVRQVEERWLNTVYEPEIPVIKFDNLES